MRLRRIPVALVITSAFLVGATGYAAASSPANSTAPPPKASATSTASAIPATPAAPTTPTTSNTNAPCNSATLQNGYARCYAIVHTAVKSQTAASPDLSAAGADQPPAGALGPSDIQNAYNIPSATAGSGETVAVVDAYGDSDAESDLAVFRSYYGLPPCTTANGCFRKVDQTGGTNYPSDDAGWALETSLDLDSVSSACPNCHILLVEANDNFFQNLGTAEDEAVSLGAKFVSNSYGGCEFSGDLPYDPDFNHPGVVVAAASGDNGYDNTGEGCTTPSWPATSPYVTSIGGTTLTRDLSSPRGWDETTWNTPLGDATGSGCSTIEPQPAYQQDLSNVTSVCPGNRAINDLSADADPATGLAVYDTIGETVSHCPAWCQVGGTSLATPLITAMYALAGPPQAGTYPVTYPYQEGNASDLHDITTGGNAGSNCTSLLCDAGPGWDGPTGLGTPEGLGALTISPYGDITGQVTDESTGAPIAGATVSTSQGYSVTTDSSGDYDLHVPTGGYDVAATRFGYAQATQTGLRVTQGQAATANLALAAVPYRTVSGTITDGSGHGWGLLARITIAGDPNGPFYTNPYTGAYSVSLPQQHTWTLQIVPLLPGYDYNDLSVSIGTARVTRSAVVPADLSSCTAPGYAFNGTTQTCDAIPGGLVAGVVTDSRTHAPVNGALVLRWTDQTQYGISAATADPGIPGGFYWLFSSVVGKTTFTAIASTYGTEASSVNVASNEAVQQNWVLRN